MKKNTKHTTATTKRSLAANGDARHGPLIRHTDDIRAPGYRINMLNADNFTVALLGEFGFYQAAIGQAMGLSTAQVRRRLRFAKVDPRTYRRGESVIGQMLLKGVSKAGVPQLRQFAEGVLANQLRQLGWSDLATERPEPEAVKTKLSLPLLAPAPSTPQPAPGHD